VSSTRGHQHKPDAKADIATRAFIAKTANASNNCPLRLRFGPSRDLTQILDEAELRTPPSVFANIGVLISVYVVLALAGVIGLMRLQEKR
jgi:hypothetical protein